MELQPGRRSRCEPVGHVTAISDSIQVSTSFVLSVVNVAPTATLSNDGPIIYGDIVTVDFSDELDASTADSEAGFHYAFAMSADNLADVTYYEGSR